MVPSVQGERTALKAQKVAMVPQEIQVHSVRLERRASSESPDYQAIQGDKDPRVQSAFQDSQEQTARKEQGAPLANQDQGGNEVQRVHVVKEVQEASPASRGQRVPPVVMAHLVPLGKGDFLDLKEPLDFQDRRAPLVHQGRMGYPVIQDREVKLDSKARLALLVLQVSSDLRVLLGKLVQWANGVIQAHLVLLVNKVCLDLLGRKGQREILALPVYLERMVLRA